MYHKIAKYFITFLLLSFSSFAVAEKVSITYAGKAGPLPVARAKMNINIQYPKYQIDFDAKSLGIASVLDYNLYSKATGKMGSTTRPESVYLKTQRKSSQRVTNMSFGSRSKPSIDIQPKWHPRGKKEVLNVNDLEGSIDPLTILIRLMNQVKLNGTCQGRFHVTDGRSAARISIRDKGQVNVRTKGYNGKAKHCQIAIRALSGRVMRDANSNELTYAHIYFSKTKSLSYHIPVKISGSFEGFSVSLEAQKIQ